MSKKSFSAFEMRERELHRSEIQNLLSGFRIPLQECGNMNDYSTEDLEALRALLKKYKTKVHGNRISTEAACQEILSRLVMQKGEIERVKTENS